MPDRGSRIKIEELKKRLEREPSTHKGDNGRVAVIGGTGSYAGAPALAAEAALRTGCDLARVLCSDRNREVVASFFRDLIVDSMGSGFDHSAVEKAVELADWSDVAVVGPGLESPDPEALREFAERSDAQLVVDAGAVEPLMEVCSSAVFTPHQGEAEPIRQGYGSILDFTANSSNVVLEKGSVDTTCAGGERYTNSSGNPTMTVGGTGDVLSGIVASLIAQGRQKAEAARYGALLSGLAGERAAESLGNGALASDIVEEIPEVLNDSGFSISALLRRL